MSLGRAGRELVERSRTKGVYLKKRQREKHAFF
jgi:hypothetical protein